MHFPLFLHVYPPCLILLLHLAVRVRRDPTRLLCRQRRASVAAKPSASSIGCRTSTPLAPTPTPINLLPRRSPSPPTNLIIRTSLTTLTSSTGRNPPSIPSINPPDPCFLHPDLSYSWPLSPLLSPLTSFMFLASVSSSLSVECLSLCALIFIFAFFWLSAFFYHSPFRYTYIY